MITDYPMTTLDEAARSIRQAVHDRNRFAISQAEFDAVKHELDRRIMQIKKVALLASVAHIGRHDYAQPKRKGRPG